MFGMKANYTDNETGAKEFANDMYNVKFFNPTIFHPDPWAKDVWLGIDERNQRASILYLADSNEEGVEYRGTDVNAYFRR